jgi:hypothetical protein
MYMDKPPEVDDAVRSKKRQVHPGLYKVQFARGLRTEERGGSQHPKIDMQS